MKYIRRILEDKLERYVRSFPCVLLAGARQVGKSTMIQHLFSTRFKEFVFDPVQDLYGAKSDPDLFLRNNPPPLILDEIQYVPELVPAIKRYVDRNRKPGMFIMTGSQQWEVMRHLSESLAGRVGILEFSGFCLCEQEQDSSMAWFSWWLESLGKKSTQPFELLMQTKSAGASATQLIWRGSYPEVQTLDQEVIAGWMRGYVSTYLQRDVRLLLEIKNETQFASFLSLAAALTAQECNHRQMGRELNMSGPTAQSWLSVLKATFQWMELPAYSNNEIKKLSQKPKGHLSDTGLACYLLRISSPDALLGHPIFGALFETFVTLELFKQVQQLSLPPRLYHFRQHSGAEIDLIVELDGILYPIEIKTSSEVRPRMITSLKSFAEKVGRTVGPGLLIFTGAQPVGLDDKVCAVPFDARLPKG